MALFRSHQRNTQQKQPVEINPSFERFEVDLREAVASTQVREASFSEFLDALKALKGQAPKHA